MTDFFERPGRKSKERGRRHVVALPAIPKTSMIPVGEMEKPEVKSFLSRISSMVYERLAFRRPQKKNKEP